MATPAQEIPSNYVLGQSEIEYQRLMMQSRLLRPYTERYFRAAGLAPGMKVLDLGCGMGDVSLLAGDIVGPGGSVLGIDRDAEGVERSRERAEQQACSSWVKFQATKFEDFDSAAGFDAIVGRYIFLYQPDPAATLRHFLRFLKPGGIAVFHELDFVNPHSSYPPCDIWDRMYKLLSDAFARSGAPPEWGRRLGPTFVAAGLPFPAIRAEHVAGGGPGSYLYNWISWTLRSVAPRLAQLGLESPVPIDETLAARLEAAAVAQNSQILGPTQIGAWARKPLS